MPSPLVSHSASWRTICLQGIDDAEILATVHAQKAAMTPAEHRDGGTGLCA
jgi:hypothetical protein